MQVRYTLVFGTEPGLANEAAEGVIKRAEEDLRGYLKTVVREENRLLVGTRVINDPGSDHYPSSLFKVQPFFTSGAVKNMRLRMIAATYYGALLPELKGAGRRPKTCFHNGKFRIAVEADPEKKAFAIVSCRRKKERVMLALPVSAQGNLAAYCEAFRRLQGEIEERLRSVSTVQMQILQFCAAAKTASA